jgi:hypothetical protein
MKVLVLIGGCIVFFTGAYFLLKEGIKEGTPKQKMYRQMYPQSLGGKTYNKSYSIIAGVGCFLAGIYLLYLLFFYAR